MAINGGVDEKKKVKVVENIEKINSVVLQYDEVLNNYKKVLTYVAELMSIL